MAKLSGKEDEGIFHPDDYRRYKKFLQANNEISTNLQKFSAIVNLIEFISFPSNFVAFRIMVSLPLLFLDACLCANT